MMPRLGIVLGARNGLGSSEFENKAGVRMTKDLRFIGAERKSEIMKTIVSLILCLTCSCAFGQKFDELAKTPPMGWNSWNTFQRGVSEKLIRETADTMTTNGMKDAGYQYVNIDDCWQGERDAQGFIEPDAKQFPSGMKALADYVHSKGLKLGIYSDAGLKTCGGRPGSLGHELQDALTYAQWGVDYLKYDWCGGENLNVKSAYTTMRDALYRFRRPMVFSMCEWGFNNPWSWAREVSHLWRTTTDIGPCFDCTMDHKTWQQWGVLQILDAQKPLRQYAGPGHWNDPDMLEVGNGMSVNEDRAHFSMWCMLAAPLIAGNDLRNMSRETLDILANKEVIAVDQDRLGIEGFAYSTNDNVEFWFKPLSGGDWAMCALNRNKEPGKISFDWKRENVSDSFSKRDANFSTTTYSVRNLWTKKEAGSTREKLTAEIPGHDVLMLLLKNNSPPLRTAPSI
jgi:alpha-galactosidase